MPTQRAPRAIVRRSPTGNDLKQKYRTRLTISKPTITAIHGVTKPNALPG
jgi:hypothetical protein